MLFLVHSTIEGRLVYVKDTHGYQIPTFQSNPIKCRFGQTLHAWPHTVGANMVHSIYYSCIQGLLVYVNNTHTFYIAKPNQTQVWVDPSCMASHRARSCTCGPVCIPICLLKIQNLRPPHYLEVMIITTSLPAKVYALVQYLTSCRKRLGNQELYFCRYQIPSKSAQLESDKQ